MNKDDEIKDLKEKLARAEGARDALRDALFDSIEKSKPQPYVPVIPIPAPWSRCWSCGQLYRGLHTCWTYVPQPQPYIWPNVPTVQGGWSQTLSGGTNQTQTWNQTAMLTSNEPQWTAG